MFDRLRNFIFGLRGEKKIKQTALIKLEFTVCYYDEMLERKSREEYHSGKMSFDFPIPEGVQVRDVMVRIVDDIEFHLHKLADEEEDYSVEREK